MHIIGIAAGQLPIVAQHFLIGGNRALLVARGELEVADWLQVLRHVELPLGLVGLRQVAAESDAFFEGLKCTVVVAGALLHHADLS